VNMPMIARVVMSDVGNQSTSKGDTGWSKIMSCQTNIYIVVGSALDGQRPLDLTVVFIIVRDVFQICFGQ
jgi:hypothetical protein